MNPGESRFGAIPASPLSLKTGIIGACKETLYTQQDEEEGELQGEERVRKKVRATRRAC